MLNEPVYVDITNVAKWEIWLDEPDYPHVIPPWPLTVFEFYLRPQLGRRLGSQKVRVALRDTVIDGVGYHQLKFKIHLDNGRTLDDWYVLADSQGAIMKSVPLNMMLADDYMYVNDSYWAVSVVLFAISLLHCKNVELVDKHIPRHERRRAARKGLPLIQYKTLVIEPFKKQVRREAAERGESEIHRALHICRGHFATYTDDAPLFGKYTGTYWKPMHVRGRADAGVIHKDYKVVVDKGE